LAQIVAIFIDEQSDLKVPQWLSPREKLRRQSGTCAAATTR
jgi:hypothetical protein